MLEGDDWSLGSMVGPNGEHHIRITRPLTLEERQRIPAALARLRDFSGHALIGPIIDALNELHTFLAELPSVGQLEYQRGPYRSRFNGRMSAALTAFTSLRSTVETNARRLDLPMGSSAPENFDRLYRKHRCFRLVWMLRNLDQHRPPATSAITISMDEDPETGKSRVRPVIDVLRVCDNNVEASQQEKYKRQWRECAALWEGFTEPVDIRAVFEQAYKACETVVAAYMREAEYLILNDARFIARLVGEVDPIGSACALRVVEGDGATEIDINVTHLDTVVFGDAVASLDAARKILGEPPLNESEVWTEQ